VAQAGVFIHLYSLTVGKSFSGELGIWLHGTVRVTVFLGRYVTKNNLVPLGRASGV
jgi:hypothetical protein